MRHLKKKVTLDRKSGPRKALLKSLATSLILYEKIRTTAAKAKAVRPSVEKMITLAKNPTVQVRRELLRKLYVEKAVKKILEVLGPKYQSRKGGYTRTIKIGPREGDGANIVQIEFV